MAELKHPTPELKVRDIMVTQVHRITPHMKVSEAVELLVKHMISGAPVVDAMDHVISIMGEGDALRMAAMYGLEATVSHCLPHLTATDKVITLTETGTFADAYRIFLKNKIHRIPIVDGNGNLKGLVTRSTLLLLFVEAHYGKKISRSSK